MCALYVCLCAHWHVLFADQTPRPRSVRSQGKASGSRAALWVRARTQFYLFHTGRLAQSHAGKIMFAGILLLAMLCIGLKNIELQTDMEDLWVEGEYRCGRGTGWVGTPGVGVPGP